MYERDLSPETVDIARELRITIEGRPPSLNARPGNWQAAMRERAEWKATAHTTTIDALNRWSRRHGLPWRKFEKCDLTVLFIVPTAAARDWDNLVSTLKPLLDGVVAAGAIVDDSNRCIDEVGLAIRHEAKRTATVLIFDEIRDD